MHASIGVLAPAHFLDSHNCQTVHCARRRVVGWSAGLVSTGFDAKNLRLRFECAQEMGVLLLCYDGRHPQQHQQSGDQKGLGWPHGRKSSTDAAARNALTKAPGAADCEALGAVDAQDFGIDALCPGRMASSLRCSGRFVLSGPELLTAFPKAMSLYPPEIKWDPRAAGPEGRKAVLEQA